NLTIYVSGCGVVKFRRVGDDIFAAMSWIILLWRDLGSKLFHTTFVFYHGGIVMALTFQERLSSAFGNASMAEIARRINAPHATVRNYFQGRMPAPEVLIKIANETNVSLNWLLL